MTPFRYLRPTTTEQATEAMASGNAVALAGGTDLVTLRRDGAVTAPVIVDLKHVAELTTVTEPGPLCIGAATPLHRVVRLRGHGVDALVDGASLVGSRQTRRRATVGGNACRSSPAGDTLPPLLVLGAEAVLVSAHGGRKLPMDEFFTGPGQTARRSDELLTELRFTRRNGVSAYQRRTYRRWMDLAVAGVACWLQVCDGICRDAAVALGAVAPTPILVPEASAALRGRVVEDALDDVVAAVRDAASPIDDVRGSAEYRRDQIGVLARDVVLQAALRVPAPNDQSHNEARRPG